MSESIVVVTGAETSPLGTLPFQKSEGFIQDARLAKVYSRCEYGNYLPDLWAEMKTLALDPRLEKPSALSQVLKDTTWTILTDTVDGLHEQAGCYPVIETSGTVFRGLCLRCQTPRELSCDDYRNLGEGEVFSCLKCGKARIRPDIVLPGEQPRHARISEDFIRDATTTVFVGVDSEDPVIGRWRELSAITILVSPDEDSRYNMTIQSTISEWADRGCLIS